MNFRMPNSTHTASTPANVRHADSVSENSDVSGFTCTFNPIYAWK